MVFLLVMTGKSYVCAGLLLSFITFHLISLIFLSPPTPPPFFLSSYQIFSWFVSASNFFKVILRFAERYSFWSDYFLYNFFSMIIIWFVNENDSSGYCNNLILELLTDNLCMIGLFFLTVIIFRVIFLISRGLDFLIAKDRFHLFAWGFICLVIYLFGYENQCG